MDQSPQPLNFDYESALLACARGDRGALQQIYARESSQLLGIALRIVRRHDLADEVLQDAFLQIWQKAAMFDARRGSGRGWIFSIVRYRALDALRKTSREVLVDEAMLANRSPTTPDLLDNLSRLAETKELQQCLEQLDQPKRQSILLAYMNGYTHVQIAAQLEVPLGTVKSWIRRGLLALRECLQ
jgi:RNA polymerase sigma-70 factor, ECF subfamily